MRREIATSRPIPRIGMLPSWFSSGRYFSGIARETMYGASRGLYRLRVPSLRGSFNVSSVLLREEQPELLQHQG